MYTTGCVRYSIFNSFLFILTSGGEYASVPLIILLTPSKRLRYEKFVGFGKIGKDSGITST